MKIYEFIMWMAIILMLHLRFVFGIVSPLGVFILAIILEILLGILLAKNGMRISEKICLR